MDPVASFPHFLAAEFRTACTTFVDSFSSLQDASKKGKWTAISLDPDEGLLRIVKELSVAATSEDKENSHSESSELQEDDEDVLEDKKDHTPLVHYDILLSPSYRVPVLYFYVCDILHRYPPTMNTLYSDIIVPEYVDQTKGVGVLGGITMADHPILNRPVFFIHPCRTAEVLKASVGGREVSPSEYLLIWMGALGKSVGLDVPLDLVLQARI